MKRTARAVSLTGIMTALVYVMTSISVPMLPPLGVWHLGDVASFIAAILCGPYIGAFACGVGAFLFDVWNPLWGSKFIIWAPATIVIRSLMGFILGTTRKIIEDNRKVSELLAMIIAAVEKNFGYFFYDFALFGAVAYMDLITFFPLSAIDIIITIPILLAIRTALKIEYLA